MSEETAALPARADDLSLLYRRCDLEKQGVSFAQAWHDGTAPRYPLRWVASWGDREAGPLPMPELVPAVEQLLGGKP